MADAAPAELTRLLNRMQNGDEGASEELAPLLYVELRRLAGSFMREERGEHTLQATALVNEAWLRLADPKDGLWHSRGQFFRLASRVMRSVLVDHARARQSAKRGGDLERRPLSSSEPPVEMSADLANYYLMLDEAMERLGDYDSELAQIAELHLIGGLQLAEMAGALGLSTRKAERGWRTARAWLRSELGEDFRISG